MIHKLRNPPFNSFSHSKDGAVLFEQDFVHECSHEVQPAPACEKQSFGFGRIGDRAVIKALSFIPHGNQDLPIHAATTDDINVLVGFFIIAMDHGVCESLADGDLNFSFNHLRRLELAHEKVNKFHELIYEWRNGSCAAGEGLM